MHTHCVARGWRPTESLSVELAGHSLVRGRIHFTLALSWLSAGSHEMGAVRAMPTSDKRCIVLERAFASATVGMHLFPTMRR